MIPTIGIVHTTLPEGHPFKGQKRAAMITAVYPDKSGEITEESKVDLTVFLQYREPQGQFHGTEGFLFLSEVEQDPTGKKPGTWHEPLKVEQKTKPAPAPEKETAAPKK